MATAAWIPSTPSESTRAAAASRNPVERNEAPVRTSNRASVPTPGPVQDVATTSNQTTADGKFSVEFVECLASCGTAPVMMCNEQFYEGVSAEKADSIVAQCQ